MTEKKGKYSDNVEDLLNKMVYDEYTTSKSNQQADFGDFESDLDILECKRNEKDYDWMSDVFMPEAPSIFLTEASQEAGQMFSQRDFTDVYLEKATAEDLLACKAAKRLINSQLNNPRVRHYQKYMQRKDIQRMFGNCYAVCWWDQKIQTVVKGQRPAVNPIFDEEQNLQLDESGEMMQQPQMEDIKEKRVIFDHFNWRPFDPRNVFTSNKYVYSAQEEPYIVLRSEMSYDDMKSQEEANEFFNLDIIKKMDTDAKNEKETETSSESYNKDDKWMSRKYSRPFMWDVLERYGTHYCVVSKRDDLGYATEVKPGYDDDGKPKENAEICLIRQTTAYRGSTKVLIRFQAEPLRDGNGIPYKPVIRGICYPHPTKKNGMSSSKYLRELQIVINDLLNISFDRTKLATLPTFIGNKYMMEDNDTVYIEPEHTIEMEDPSQFKELKISGDVSGAMQMYGIARNLTQQVEAVYPTTMGDVGKASVTATAVAGADTRANSRANYRNLTDEYTFNCEFYWMILQMAWQFMNKQTIEKIFTPEEIMAFKPAGDYSYQPITSAIEAEHSKQKKIQMYDQLIGRLQGLVESNPQYLTIITYMIGEIMQLMGAEGQIIKPMIDEMMKKNQKEPKEEGGGEQPKDMKDEATSNQGGLPQSGMEEQVRQGMDQPKG